MERIPYDGWQRYAGHVQRYAWAAEWLGPNLPDRAWVNDIACGIGYGARILEELAPRVRYRGYDRPGVPDDRFPGEFFAADLNDAWWRPERAVATLCFETLEHVKDPVWLASTIAGCTRRAVFVSVPVEPTKHLNGHHLHDFEVDDIPPLFPGFHVAEDWAQPSELSHVWRLERDL